MRCSDIASITPPDFSTPDPDRKLRDGARDFEAMMLGEMLKPLHFGNTPGEEEEGGAGDTLRSFGTEAVAKGIAGHGGFGLADKIVRQVHAEREAQAGSRAGTKV